MKPSRPPEEVLRRVLKFSRLNGWSVVVFAGLSTLGALALGDPMGIAVSLLVTLGGALEVHGYRLLKRGQVDGLRWLIRSQLMVLGVIWAYAGTRLVSFDEGTVREAFTSEMRSALSDLGLTFDDILPLVRRTFHLLYGGVLAVTLLYQGGLALYYRRRGRAIEIALQPPPVVPRVAAPTPPPEDYLI
jgi:hypothetical protein